MSSVSAVYNSVRATAPSRSAFAVIDSKLYLREVILRRDDVPDLTQYPFALPAIAKLGRLAFPTAVTFLVGENGSGKSTLLEAIAVALGYNAEGGSKNFAFATRSSHSELHRYLRPVRGVARPRDGFFLRAETYFNVATEIERLDAEPMAGPAIAPSYGPRALQTAPPRRGDGLHPTGPRRN